MTSRARLREEGVEESIDSSSKSCSASWSRSTTVRPSKRSESRVERRSSIVETIYITKDLDIYKIRRLTVEKSAAREIYA